MSNIDILGEMMVGPFKVFVGDTCLEPNKISLRKRKLSIQINIDDYETLNKFLLPQEDAYFMFSDVRMYDKFHERYMSFYVTNYDFVIDHVNSSTLPKNILKATIEFDIKSAKFVREGFCE